MSNDNTDENENGEEIPPADEEQQDERIHRMEIQDEMRASYLTYAMSVIISRALPDVRDGLKPAQRRILVAMNDLNLGPNSSRVKCAKISGDTSGNYHPHGESVIYPTLTRLAQNWIMREPLIDPQGNFGSLAGLPPAAMRYTEARMSAISSEMLEDLNRDTVDFVPTYDQRNTEPVVLPSKVPNLLVNGANGIAVGMATSIPPHNLGEVCDAVTLLIDNPDSTIDELLNVIPGPDFPTGGIICGRFGIRQGYMTGRSTLTLRAKTHFETEKRRDIIVVTEIPYLETRDRIKEKLEDLVKTGRVKGISRVVDLTDRKVPPWQVRLHIELKTDADKEVVLNQLYRFSPLQTTVSVILLALVSNRPETLSLKGILQEFLRHRIDVIRRRTEFLLNEARSRKHTVEGLLIAQLDIDQIISTIRNSPSRSVARDRLQEIEIPAEMVHRALGDGGFEEFRREQGIAETYHLSSRQAEAIVSMQLGSLANLEREKLGDEHKGLLERIEGYLTLLSDEANIRAVIREELQELKRRFGDPRRTLITDEELTNVNRDDLITEEPMVVTLTHRGYIKRVQLSVYQAQNRGGKGIMGAKTDEEDPIEHLFVASTHAYLLFFTDKGRVHWLKVYDLPLGSRTAKGRALINVLQLQEDEGISNCLGVRQFDDNQFLIFATQKGIVKKTSLSQYARPMKGGIIAINLDDDDALIDVRIASGNDDIVLATRDGMAIRFAHKDARSQGRNTRGVKGIRLGEGDAVVGMVIAQEDRTLLTICENGYGKRTPFGSLVDEESDEDSDSELAESSEAASDVASESSSESTSSNMRYRRQKRGGKGVRDIKTSTRNGKVMAILSVIEDEEVLMVTANGKIQRIRVSDIRLIGRNTQGVRIIRMDEDDSLVSCARIPNEFEVLEEEISQQAASSVALETATESGNETPDETLQPNDSAKEEEE